MMTDRTSRRETRDGRSSLKDVNANVTPQHRSASKRTFMDRWVEPSLEEKPSWETGLGTGPYGVMSDMQSLGEPPNAKVKSRVKPEVQRKSGLAKGWATVGPEGQETPEATPAPVAQSIKPEPPPAPAPPPAVVDDDDDEDYAPGAKGKKKETSAKPRGSKKHSRAGPSSPAKPLPRKRTKKGPINQNKHYNAEKLKKVVDAAMQRAHSVNKPDLATAVHEIWLQSLEDKRLTELLEAILTQHANDAQTKEFQEYVRRAKKKLRDEKKIAPSVPAHRDQPAASANGTPALPHRSPSKPADLNETEPSATPSIERLDAPKHKISLKLKSPKKDPNHRRASHGKKMSKSPEKRKVAHHEDGDDSSSLSSLTSMDENDGVDADQLDEFDAPPSPNTNGVKGKGPMHRDSLRVAVQDRNLKRTSVEAEFPEDERDRILAAKKTKLEESVARDYAYEESDIRSSQEASLKARNSRTRNGTIPPRSLHLTNGGRAGRAVSQDLESPLSEISQMSSRRSTPHVYKGPPKQPGKRAKTKQSPEKKHQTGYGGMSGAGGAGRESPIGDDDNEELSENNDFCSSCGGSGFLLCCDGCDRSFHFTCLDPPLNEDASELNEPWYCFICVAKRPVTAEQPQKAARGLFAPLLNSLNKRNPSTFALPQDLREYFEGVAADRTGLFVEAVNTRQRNSKGYDELPDYYKTRDGKGNTILCYSCGKSSQSRRQLIQCDYCSQYWHLDCLDPPLANAPARSLEGKKLHDWMCPLHVDHELRKVDTSMLRPRRKVHVRRPRNAKVLDTSLNRGFENTGVVDVEIESSDDSDSEFYDEDGQEEGVVYRMPSRGIKLDFIDRIKNGRLQNIRDGKYRAEKRTQLAVKAPSQLDQANFAKRSFLEKHLALNLAQFASANRDLDLGNDQVENLVGTLIAEAPADVVADMTAAEEAEKTRSATSAIPPSPPPSEQPDQLSAELRKELQMLQELIRRRLEASKT